MTDVNEAKSRVNNANWRIQQAHDLDVLEEAVIEMRRALLHLSDALLEQRHDENREMEIERKANAED